MNKVCNQCGVTKSEAEFYPIKSGKRAGKREGRCVECLKAKAAAFRQGLRDSGEAKAFNRKHALRANFGLTPVQYDAMFTAQGCKCAACGTTENGVAGRAMPVDHDHATGVIRGILCTPCNQAAGHAYDSPDRLEAVAAFLRRHELRETATRLGLIAAAQ